MKITIQFTMLFTAFFGIALFYFLYVHPERMDGGLYRKSFVGWPARPLRNPLRALPENCLICE